MYFNEKKGKGVLDRSFPARKVFLHKDANYESVLCRMRREVFPKERKEFSYTYYISDSGGTCISNDGNIYIQDAQAGEKNKNTPNFLQCIYNIYIVT